MKYTNLKEEIAQIIFLYEGGIYPDEYEKIMGTKKTNWKKVYSYHTSELAEHERDDYRLQARKVLEYLLKNDLLEIK